MNIRSRFGTALLAVCALALIGLMTPRSGSAQAVSSLPVAIYQGTCTSETIEFLTDLEPIVPAASVSGATFAGSDEAIDVATSSSTLDVSFDELMSNAPLAIIVASGTDEDGAELACGVIGGFVSENAVVFGIDDANDSGVSGVGSVADLGGSVSITIILGEFPMGESGTADVATTGTTCVDGAVAVVPGPHAPPSSADADGDGLDDADETTDGTDPTQSDSDGDGQMDGIEVAYSGTDPLDPSSIAVDSDGDALPDDLELSTNLDPNNADSDNDGIPDGWETFLGNDPLDPESPLDAGTDISTDSDQDGLTNRTEFEMGTDPANPDSDLDGISDGDEVQVGTNPTTANC